MPPAPAVDHLVVAAEDLTHGVPALEEQLGVRLAGGGRHAAFGTHNALLAIGGATYLELIAIDPDAPAPGRPRWFGLDTAAVRSRLTEGPQLLHWVARPAVLPPGPDDHGERLHLSRDALSWTVTVPADGSLPGDGSGLVPSLIAWDAPDGAHPTDALEDAGVRLERLLVSSPGAPDLRRRLAALGLSGCVTVADGPPDLRAELRTPSGPVVIGGP
ncbi:VOC family protein [Actinomycetospora lutea]|uniref:VOC family protein n=1 Tax=Actinomycetospora lutea TaxID=663604 RepID=UPI002366F81A|nr:VOC family protein [Actinomycetospora lutea]MDD7936999.1 VOC family protein [Actinomycetospora lutea]